MFYQLIHRLLKYRARQSVLSVVCVGFLHMLYVILTHHYVHENNYKMDLDSAKIIAQEASIHERLFLEAWLSIKDLVWGRTLRHPGVYKCFVHAPFLALPFFWILHVTF